MSFKLSPGAVQVVSVTAVFTFFALFFVVLRLIARFGFTKTGRRDEVAIVGSMVCSIVVFILTIREGTYGLGYPSAQLTLNDTQEFLKSLYFAIIFYNLSLSLTKFAIVLQYMRVFTAGRVKFWCRVSMAVVIIQGLECVLHSIFNCIPVSKFWDVTMTTGHCVDQKILWFLNAGFAAFTDIVLLVLPVPVLLKLALPKKQKILLMFVFALGGFALLVSFIRVQSLIQATQAEDLILENINSGMWSTIEINTGIICASLQTIRPIIARCFPKLFESTNRHAYGNKSKSISRGYIKSVGTNNTDIEMFGDRRSHVPTTHRMTTTTTSTEVLRGRAGSDEGHDIMVTKSIDVRVETKETEPHGMV